LKEILDDIRELKPSINSKIGELERCCRLLDDIQEAESRFLKCIDSQKIFMERVKSHFDLPGSDDAVKSLYEVIQDIESWHRGVVEDSSDEQLDSPEWLKETERRLRHIIGRDIEEIKDLLLENLWIPFSQEILKKGKQVNRLLATADGRVAVSDVENDWQQISLPNSIDEFLSGRLKASEYIQNIQSLMDKVVNRLSGILNEDEIAILNECINISSDSEEDWIEQDAIIDAMQSSSVQYGESIEGILSRLEKAGFLSPGFRIQF
jgi:hypothetical protein